MQPARQAIIKRTMPLMPKHQSSEMQKVILNQVQFGVQRL